MLAVSTALLTSAMFLIGGQRQRTEFAQAVRELDSQIRDVMNDVATGYYPKIATVSCTSGGSGPVLSDTGNVQGTNVGCIFIGRGLQFKDSATYDLHTIVGRRTFGAPVQEATNLTESRTKSIYPDGTHNANGVQTINLQAEIRVKKICYTTASCSLPGEIGTFAVFTPAPFATNGSLTSGSQQRVNLVPVTGTALNNTTATAATQIGLIPNNLITDPANGITMCIEGGSGQHATLSIGGSNRSLDTTLIIDNGVCT